MKGNFQAIRTDTIFTVKGSQRRDMLDYENNTLTLLKTSSKDRKTLPPLLSDTATLLKHFFARLRAVLAPSLASLPNALSSICNPLMRRIPLHSATAVISSDPHVPLVTHRPSSPLPPSPFFSNHIYEGTTTSQIFSCKICFKFEILNKCAGKYLKIVFCMVVFIVIFVIAVLVKISKRRIIPLIKKLDEIYF